MGSFSRGVMFLTGGLIFGATLAFSQNAFATKGREAVGMCIDSTASGNRCAWSVNDKGEIDICNKNGCVFCPGADQECKVTKSRPRPTRGLPVGTTVTTSVGTFKVTPRVVTGSLADVPADKVAAYEAEQKSADKAPPEKAPAEKAPAQKAPAEKATPDKK